MVAVGWGDVREVVVVGLWWGGSGGGNGVLVGLGVLRWCGGMGS